MNRQTFFGLLPAGAMGAVPLPPQKGLAETGPRPEANREPAPIGLPAATVARARTLLTDLQAVNIDRAQFDPQMNTLLTDDALKSGANEIRPYGDPLTFTPVELRTTAEGNSALFRVRFATETLTWAVRVSPQGMINGFDLRRNARDHVYRVVTRLIEGY